MKFREKFITFLICIIVLGLYFLMGSYKREVNTVNKLYKVYLNGSSLGMISSKKELYDLIDKKQQTIKDKYSVDNVYPPNGLKIVDVFTYNDNIKKVSDVYDKIEESDEFTISGYEIKLSKTEEHDEYSIYVLNKKVFNDAVMKFILAFIDEEKLNEYMNGTQGDIEDVKKVYQELGIVEDIVIKETYISTKEKIYEDADELAQDLLFGFNHDNKSYTVKSGDTIASISEEHTLNVQEFLIANPKFSSEDSLLAIGEEVNITLINPEIAFSYKVNEIKETEINFDTKIERDNSKPSNYSETKTLGVTGITLNYSNYSVTNGEMSSDANIYYSKIIREKVDQVTVKGKKNSYAVFGSTTWKDTGSGWRWPTNSPYMVTSEFAPRWGRHHDGIDISGTGFGSNIYAANDGVVEYVNKSCADDGGSRLSNTCGGGMGNYVVINHGDNYYTVYGHLTAGITVRVGQQVARGKVIGYMGNSGRTTGYHLHFGFAYGFPGRGGTYRNPRELFR